MGETGSSLSLSPFNRAASGLYSVVVANAFGQVTRDIQVRVLMPQRLETPILTPDGAWRFRFSDADGTLLPESDLSHFEVQISSDLSTWVARPCSIQTLQDGVRQFDDPPSADSPARFYRVVEQ